MRKIIEKIEDAYVVLEDISDCSIYAFKGGERIYKAHKIYRDKWAFLAIDNSLFWANGEHDTLRELIKSNLNNPVYEFDNVKEFCKWALKNS